MTAPLPPVDARALTALADAFLQACAEFPKMRKVLERTLEIAQEEALSASVRSISSARASPDEAEARQRAAAFVELAMRRSEERAALAAVPRAKVG